MFEFDETLPDDLDACGAHFGFTPDSPFEEVYHHHVQSHAPFSVGCYGPNLNGGPVSLEECRSYYSTCGDGDTVTIETAKGKFLYDPWCPCYENGSNVVVGGNQVENPERSFSYSYFLSHSHSA
jgi:hypothetical protein